MVLVWILFIAFIAEFFYILLFEKEIPKKHYKKHTGGRLKW